MEHFSFYVRSALLTITHLAIWSCALVLAYAFRFDFSWHDIALDIRGAETFLLFYTFRLAAFIYWDLSGIRWRHVSIHDVSRIVKAHFSSTAALATFCLFTGTPNFPRSVILIELALSVLACASLKLSVRLFLESRNAHRVKHSAASREVLVIGGGEAGHLLVKTLLARHQLPYLPIGILDDNPTMRGRNVYGVEVIGRLSDLRDLLDANPKIGAVILAIPSLSVSRTREVQECCNELGVTFKRIQNFEDIALTDIATRADSVASIESVLERDESVSHGEEISSFITGKAVAVTGAGGSIGSELVRQLLNFNPESLTLIDNNEFHIFKLQRELAVLNHRTQVNCCVANIVDEPRMSALFSLHKPKILFHAAAYKHVPLMEENAHEALQNNVIGTRNLLRSCIIGGIEHFTFISTDKAVNSCSVMGHSKRLGELLVQEYTREAKKKNRPFTSAIVRFGNVINSNGSVVPLFKEQILSGGPVTVTHPEMRRFFMSIREAVRLVLAASSIGREGEVFLLDMGKPVRIEDVAKKMLALYGRRDIQIVYSGIRPGERLFEELTGPGEQTFTTPLKKVSRVISPPSHHRATVISWVTQIESRLPLMNSHQIRDAMSGFLWDDTAQKAQQPLSA